MPKVINGSIKFTRGSFNYDNFFEEDKINTTLSSLKGKVYESISWNARHRRTSGFKQTCWWSGQASSSWEWLVALTYAGQLLVLECETVYVCEAKSWKVFNIPVIEELSKTCLITCINHKFLGFFSSF